MTNSEIVSYVRLDQTHFGAAIASKSNPSDAAAATPSVVVADTAPPVTLYTSHVPADTTAHNTKRGNATRATLPNVARAPPAPLLLSMAMLRRTL